MTVVRGAGESLPGIGHSDGIDAAIGIIVVNFGSHELIDANLTGIGLSDRVLVVIVDNFSGSTELDAIRELTARRGWTLVELSENRGFGAGANAGAREAIRLGAECLLFLNPDVIIDTHVVDEIRRQCLIAPETLVSPRVLTVTGDVYFVGAEMEMAGGRMRRPGNPGSRGDARTWLSGACLGMGTTMFELTGGMNERYFMYWEDVDLSVRAVAAGGALVVRGDLFVTHDEGGTQGTRRGRAKSGLYYYYNCRNRLLFAAQQLDRKDILRWIARTPGSSWEILMRGGRRQLLQSPEPLLAAIAGSLAGLGLAGRVLLGKPTVAVNAGGHRRSVAPGQSAVAGESGDPLRVIVAVLTYRRPAELAAVLPELVHQARAVAEESNGQYAVDVLVVDNDPAGSAAGVAGAHPLVRYRIEPRPGVSAARNCALDAARDADLLAFIDDDERPHPEWLSRLVQTQRHSGAAAVAGRVLEAFDREPDSWIRAGRFFQRSSRPTGQQVHAAGAGNLLLDLRQIRSLGLRFDERFGLSGGEDTHFTATLRRRGGSIVWCNEAVVTDQVPAARATRDWVLHRAWSHGNSDSVIQIALADAPSGRLRARLRALARGSARIAGGGARSAWGRISGDDRHHARGLRAVWRGAGMMAGAVGKVYQEYARPAGPLTMSPRLGKVSIPSRKPPDGGAD